MKLRDFNFGLVVALLIGCIFWLLLILLCTGCAQLEYKDVNGQTKIMKGIELC